MFVIFGYIFGWVIVIIILRAYFKSNQQKSVDLYDVFSEKRVYDKLLEQTEDFETLRKALLRRSIKVAKTLWRISDQKSSLSSLVKSGAVNDELWSGLQKAENNLTVEIYDVQTEADYLKEGWGKAVISEGFQLAAQEKKFKEFVKERKKKEKEEKRAKGAIESESDSCNDDDDSIVFPIKEE